MLTQSKETRNAWRASQRTLDIKVTIDGKTYGATDINSLKYDSGAYNGDTFAIGSTYSNTVQIEFSHLVEGLKLGMEVHPSIGIKTSSGYVYEPLGVFIISSEIKMDRNNNLTTVSASDRFCGLEGTYVSKLTYPAKVLDVIAEICAQSGVKANTDDLARLPHQADLPAPITGQSYRKALGWIAQLYVGYALFDRQGLFTIRTISEPNYELDPSQYEQAGLTKNEAAYKVNGIQCQVTLTTKTRDGESTEETKTYQAGDATGSQIKLENNIMTPQRLNDIWEQLKDITFYPFSLNWFGNPAVEAGDWLRLEDKQGNSFVVPNSSYTLDFNGGLSATSKADQTTSSDQMVPWQGSVAQTIKKLQLRRLPDGTVVFPPSVTAPPTNAKFNDVWFKKNGNSTELWIFEKQDDGSGKWIRKDLSDDEIKKKVTEAQQGLNQAKADIINNKQKADADIENLNKSIEANKKVADESLQKLSDSVTNLQGQYDNNIVPNLNKVMSDASDALQKYITAQNSIADLTKQAQVQGKNIADVTNTVKGLNINYANLAGDVNSTKVDVRGLQTTLGTANGDIAQLKLDAQNLQTLLAGKVDNATYTNFVNLTNQALNAKLTASDLSGYAKTADLRATANGLKLNIDSVTDRMNNLKIGGRNLILNSDKDVVIESKTTDLWPAWCNKAIYWDLTPGETYTFSVSATNTNNVQEASMRIWNSASNKEVGSANFYFLADGKRHSKTFTIPKDGTSYSVWLYAGHMGKIEGKSFTTTFHHPMLQIGNAGTEWAPSTDDVQHDLTELSAQINATSKQFSSYYTKSETDSKANTAKNDAINSIKNDGNWQGLSNILTNSGFLQTADGFLQKVQQTTIPMFGGGGVNLARGTSDKWSSAWNNFNGKSNQTKQLGRFYTRNLNVGDWITISVNYQYQNLSGSGMQIALQADGNVCGWENGAIYPGDWQHLQASSTLKTGSIERHIKVTSSLIQNEYYEVQLRVDNASSGWLQWIYFQVNKGTVRPPWAPAPEDMATQSAFSELSQSLEGLRSTVSGNYGQLQNTISQTNQATRNKLINKITGVENKTTSTANSLNSVIGRIGSLEHLTSVQVVNNAINANDYTTTGTYFVQSTSSSNVPATNWFYLEVQKADNGRIAQVWQADSNPTLRFVRTKIGDSWSNWQRSASYSEYSELSRTVSGLRSTVSGNYNTLTNQIAQTNQTTRNEITDKVAGLQNQITANANSFNVSLSKIQQTDGINLLKGTRDFTGDWVQRNDWTRDGWVDPNGNYAVKRKGAWSGVFQRKWLETGTYIFSVYHYLEASDSNTRAWVYVSPNDDKTIQVTENSSAALEIRNNGWIKKTYIFTVTKPGTSALRVETNSSTATIHVGSYKLERGSTATPWTPNPQDIYMNPNVATKIYTSAQDLNNLRTAGNYVIKATNNHNSPISNWLVVRVDGTGDRLHQTISADNNPDLGYTRTYNDSWSDWQRTVTGGNIMAQINMSAGTTLIQNDKIYMDASSTIFSGNAFIPSAAITSLTADKITAGTINGAKVNVINLNANNITAGTLKGSNGEFYLDSGALHVWQNNHDAWIDQNGIHDYDNQGNNVWIKKGGISAYGNTSSIDIRDGEIHLNKKMGISDGVLASDYGNIKKVDNILQFGTSGLDITGTDGFILKTNGWDNSVINRMSGEPINGSGMAGNKAGYMQLGAGRQIILYAGSPVSDGKAKEMPRLVLGGALTNGESELNGWFSSYRFTSPSGSINGGFTLGQNSVLLNSFDGKSGLFTDSNSATLTAGDKYISVGGIWPGVKGDFNVSGNFTVSGSKNAIVSTSRGMAAINAYETAEYYFGDISEAVTNSDGELTVMIDPFFLETVNTVVPYQVFLTSYGGANVWIASRSANCFVVKSSKPNIHFAWEIKAKRKGYENDRMEIVKGVNQNE
ncbi:peptidase [Limosilactobacillus balticus]|uniref:Peptidase n=1 Tax=Limosilactobacillus balticus TaxID=2759747 RepID=A0ABS8RED6_9LACO|nr:peptidase [Limosilactobacillus balticus]